MTVDSSRLQCSSTFRFLPPHRRTGSRAADRAASEEDPGSVDLFGFTFEQSERYKIGGELMAGWSHDGAQATLGFEKQGRIGWAILSVSGRVSDHVRYYVSVNPVSETTSRPACGEKDYFFPNDPNLYAAQGPIVKCDEEDGLKRVDTYNTFSLDYITQQGILREGYIDWGMSDTSRCAAAASSCRSGSRRATSARPPRRT